MLPPTLKGKSFFPAILFTFFGRKLFEEPFRLGQVYNLLFTAFKRIFLRRVNKVQG